MCFRLRARARRSVRRRYVDTMSYELGQHFLQSEFSRLSINECQEDNREGRLQWRKLIKLIENHIGIASRFSSMTNEPVPSNRFHRECRNSFDLIAVDQISDFLNHPSPGLLVWISETRILDRLPTLPSCSEPSGQWYSVLFGSRQIPERPQIIPPVGKSGPGTIEKVLPW